MWVAGCDVPAWGYVGDLHDDGARNDNVAMAILGTGDGGARGRQYSRASAALRFLFARTPTANKEVDPAEEEAKGGSGEVGKMLLSSGTSQLALHCYVPASKVLAPSAFGRAVHCGSDGANTRELDLA